MLPEDVREYFAVVDGTGEEFDDELTRFWTLSEMKPVQEELTDIHTDRYSYPRCFVFADWLLWFWAYAVRLPNEPSQTAAVFRVTGGDPPGEQMASSFRQFMAQYADDPSSIL